MPSSSLANDRPSANSNQWNKGRAPAPPQRHAAPSAPWPWVDINDEIDPEQLDSFLPPIPPLCDHKNCDECWKGYPQSRFPNWTADQVKRSKIGDAVDNTRACTIHCVDVNSKGFFTNADVLTVEAGSEKSVWHTMIHTNTKSPENARIRALFIENLSGSVLRMLGTRYNIEPFFFSSALNWIPSKYQEDKTGQGDHITVTLTFLKSVKGVSGGSISQKSIQSSTTTSTRQTIVNPTIDIQDPLKLSISGHLLVLDLLSIHLIRQFNGGTIISYHPDKEHSTSAPYLHKRIRSAGQSVYWQNIFQRSSDPTFVLITFLWHAVYAWDEALDELYEHICYLESQSIDTEGMGPTGEFHIIRAHHLHYSSLLDDFRETVKFIHDTRNPALETAPSKEKEFTIAVMDRECTALLAGIDRLEMRRKMQDKRLKNAMNLIFSTVNILVNKNLKDMTETAVQDNKYLQTLTEAARRDNEYLKALTEAAIKDNAAMKQIAYLTMIFLPASFVAAAFGMNIRELEPGSHGSLHTYIGTALSLTVVTIWIIGAFQAHHVLEKPSIWERIGWPITTPPVIIRKIRGGKDQVSSQA